MLVNVPPSIALMQGTMGRRENCIPNVDRDKWPEPRCERHSSYRPLKDARHPNVSVIKLNSNTLAGNIQNDFVEPASLTHDARLGGCARLAAHVHISSQGDVFMCCLDYWQEAKFGNIAVAELDEILGGTIAASHRRQVYGLADADANLLCRKCCHIRGGSLVQISLDVELR